MQCYICYEGSHQLSGGARVSDTARCAVACVVDGTIEVVGSSSLGSDTLLLYRVWTLSEAGSGSELGCRVALMVGD